MAGWQFLKYDETINPQTQKLNKPQAEKNMKKNTPRHYQNQIA